MKNTFSLHKFFHPHLPLVILVILPLFSFLVGCSSQSNATSSNNPNTMGLIANLPGEIQKAPPTVREAYEFAVTNPDALKNVPCYCGCGVAGHTSNYSCYIKDIKPTGEIVIDRHALGCSICVDIARDVMKMTKEGKSPKDIRVTIDQTYSQYGPSNMTSAQ